VSAALQALQASLRRLHANGHPCGLEGKRAQQLCGALAAGSPLQKAARSAGLDARLTRVVCAAGSVDVPTVLGQLLDLRARSAPHARALRSAASYPLLLAFAALLCGGIVLGVGRPALAALPLGSGGSSAAPLLAALLVPCGLLVALCLVVLGRLRLPFLGRGWQRIEGYELLAGLRVLVRAGTPLPRALRAAAGFCSGKGRRGAEALAGSLEAGGKPPEHVPLLDAHELALLAAAASFGALPESLDALAEQRERALEREVPAQAMAIEVTAMVLAGLALLCVGAAFFSSYTQAVAG